MYPFSGRDRTVTVDCYVPPLGSASAFHTNNLCAKAVPLLQRHAESRNVLKSYLVPLSDFSGTSGMLKSKSLDKLDEIMRNDPILRDDYYARAAAPCSRSTQTQTDERYTKTKKPRRPRNDRPRSQILPPTYLQLPSVTWLAGELSDANAKGQAQQSKQHEAENVWGENYPPCTPRRKSKQEQAQIVQRWITEVIEHKREQELQKQSVKPAVVREKSAKLKKKSRSVPEHAFRGKLTRFDHEDRRRASDDSDSPSDQCKRQRNDSDEKSPDIFFPRLRHSGSDPNFKSAMSRRTRDETLVSTSGQQNAGTSPICDGERISPSLQSRIRSLNESFQGNNQSPSVQVNSSSQTSDGQAKRLKVSNPDLPLISRLLSDKELDSEC